MQQQAEFTGRATAHIEPENNIPDKIPTALQVLVARVLRGVGPPPVEDLVRERGAGLDGLAGLLDLVLDGRFVGGLGLEQLLHLRLEDVAGGQSVPVFVVILLVDSFWFGCFILLINVIGKDLIINFIPINFHRNLYLHYFIH